MCGDRLSGGLDSTLALLVTIRAFDELKLPHKDIIAVTMPCFGTTDRTYQNASLSPVTWVRLYLTYLLKMRLFSTLKILSLTSPTEAPRTKIPRRVRGTQVLMDIAINTAGFVVGQAIIRAGARLGNIQRRPYVNVRCKRVSAEITVRHLVKFVAGQ
jgi:NAD+ synthase (glutamine-hydrolysing)